MIRSIYPAFSRIVACFKREEGNATIEFAFFFPLMVTLLLSSIEIGILTIRQVMLEHAVDLTVRDLRLGNLINPTQDDLRDLICERSSVISSANCSQSLLIELRPVSTVTWTPLASDTTCKERTIGSLDPVIELRPGLSHEMVLIRVCAVFEPIFPSTKLGVKMSKDELGGYALVSSSAFVNEPS